MTTRSYEAALAEQNCAYAQFDDLAARIRAKPVRSLMDVVERAELAWASHEHFDPEDDPFEVLAERTGYPDEDASNELIAAVLSLALGGDVA